MTSSTYSNESKESKTLNNEYRINKSQNSSEFDEFDESNLKSNNIKKNYEIHENENNDQLQDDDSSNGSSAYSESISDSLSDSSEDIFSYSKAKPLDEFISPSNELQDIEESQKKDDKDIENDGFLDLEVELFKNKNLKKRKRPSLTNDEEDQTKRRTIDYRAIISDSYKKREEIRELLNEAINSENNSDEIETVNKSSFLLQKKLKQADEEFDRIVREACRSTQSNVYSNLKSNNSNVDNSVIENALKAIHRSELNEAYSKKKMQVIDEEINRVFQVEKQKREIEDRIWKENMEKMHKPREKLNTSVNDNLIKNLGTPININIRVGPEEIYQTEVGSKANTQQLCEYICKTNHFDPKLCYFLYDGDKLKGNEILEDDLDLEDGDILEMKVPPEARLTPPISGKDDVNTDKDKFTISIQYQKGQSVEILVSGEYTSKILENFILQKHPRLIEGKKVNFYFDGNRLKDGETLESLGVEEEDTIEMRRL